MGRVPVLEGKLLYHLTAYGNLQSILTYGLLARDRVPTFRDVADPQIIDYRREIGLLRYVPFHFFAGTPFAGAVQTDRQDEEFIYICITRRLARTEQFQIIPAHPMTDHAEITVHTFDEGLEAIDWEAMDRRNYHDAYCKNVCMAECISHRAIDPNDISHIFVKYEQTKQAIIYLCNEVLGRIPFHISVNPRLFL